MLRYMCFALLLSGLAACGSNSFKEYEDENVPQDAVIYLEKNDPDKAIEILEKELQSKPGDATLISILATAYAQKHGLDALQLALSFGSSATESGDTATEEGRSDIAKMWPYLPDATDENIDGINYSIQLLEQIPTAQRIDADHFKHALHLAADISLRMKALDANGDGILSTEELLNLTAASASAVIDGLLSAAVAAGLAGSQGENVDEATADIQAISAEIDAQPGSTQEEKLQNYFANNQT